MTWSDIFFCALVALYVLIALAHCFCSPDDP